MNETTLNALINLFAVFSAIAESKKEEAVHQFTLYLESQLGILSVDEYIGLFEALIDMYGVGSDEEPLIDIQQQAETISKNIKTRLQKNEQIMVFLRFLELAQSGNVAKAEKLFEKLASVFEIDKDELLNFKNFIFSTSNEEINSNDFLLIDAKPSHPSSNFKHLHQKNISGNIVFLKSKLIGHFIFTLKGNVDITLEGNPVLANRFYAFKEGSILRGTRITPIYYTDIAAAFSDKKQSNAFVFSGDQIDFRFNNSDNGLHNFTFSESSGQLIAVMGGSGVGKSTLLNILNGNITIQKGSICINGNSIYEHKQQVQGLIGFVPQDDLLFEDLTVWENLYYNARLCFDKLSDEEIRAKVEKILLELELDTYQHLKVGSPLKKVISGGQRKRLNVALELIREPAILFVDEPTSGLSSTDSEKVMLLLKQQARKGKLIVVNIHQPSSAIYKLFDKLWILDKGGRPIFTGNPLDAIIHFKTQVNHVNAEKCECASCGNVNPEQVLEIIEAKTIDSSGNFTTNRRFKPEQWHRFHTDYIEENPPAKVEKQLLPVSEFKKPGRLKQFKIFFERNLRTKITDTQYMLINLVEAPLLALIVGYFTKFAEASEYIFFENKSLISYLFMSIVVILFMGMSVSAEEIVKDRKILQRESFLNLSRFSYLNSKILFLLLLSAVQAFSFAIIGNLMLEIDGMTLQFGMILFATAVFSNLVGLNISSAFDSVVTIYILIPLLLIPQILLCGVIVKFDDLQNKTADKDAVPIIGDLMAARWAFEAMAAEQYSNNKYMANFFEIEKEMARSRYISDLLTTELIGQVDLVTGWQKLGINEDETRHKINIIKNEIEKLNAQNRIPEKIETVALNPASFNYEIGEKIKEHLRNIQDHENISYKKMRKEKDQIISANAKEYGKNYLYQKKLKNHNQALEALVLNSETKEYYRETANGLMQKVAPIYKAPDFNNGRSHFLSSEKQVLGKTFSTLNFNLLVIWTMCLVLYMALYYDWLRKLIGFTSKARS